MDFFKHEPQIILLDYQCTLCANGAGRTAWLAKYPNRSYADWIRGEIMRDWLIPLLKDKYVILITARREWWMQQTLQRIEETLHWLPSEYYFNPDGMNPPEHKERILHQYVFPKYGSDPEKYLALESNANTRRMYARYGIPAFRIDQPLDSLPS